MANCAYTPGHQCNVYQFHYPTRTTTTCNKLAPIKVKGLERTEMGRSGTIERCCFHTITSSYSSFSFSFNLSGLSLSILLAFPFLFISAIRNAAIFLESSIVMVSRIGRGGGRLRLLFSSRQMVVGGSLLLMFFYHIGLPKPVYQSVRRGY